MRTHAHARAHTHTHTHTMYIVTHTHKHAHTNTHTHTHTHTGLRSLEDAVSYLKKEDLSRMSLDAKRQEILCTELDQVRENILQKNSNPSAPSSPSRRISMDEWLKKKQEEERARKKKAAKDMKAAAPKKNVIR